MNTSFAPIAADALRSATVVLYQASTPADILAGTATGTDLSPYCTRVTQKPAQADITLVWNHELDGTAQPKSGNLIGLFTGAQLLWTGIIESIASYTFKRGTRELQITVRTRDGNALWRTSPRVSPAYPGGTQLSYIAQQIATALGLGPSENQLPPVSAYTVHSNTQLANVTAWDMLTTLYQSSGYEPYVDAQGRLKCISRDTTRPADIVLTGDRIVSISGSFAKPASTAVRIKWLDPNLSKTTQLPQSFAQVSLTAGFFQPTVKRDVFFSSDHTQRASDTYLVIKQSCNSGLLPVAVESYEPLTEIDGRITLTNTYFSAAFVTGALVAAWNASYIADLVVSLFGGETVPVGRVIQATLILAAMIVMSSIGTGSYEIWGTPYNFVYAMNTTEAYDSTAPNWQENINEIENDFVMNEPMAQAFAAREFLYAYRSATSYGAEIVDDPRIEVGDIVQLSDGSRLYVTDYDRDLTRGAPATLSLTGFMS